MRLKPLSVPLLLIVLLALLLRLPGLFYGFPLTTIISDEPSLILSALKMLELKVIVPALVPEAFAGLLYYPPYLAYLYLLPFAGVAGLILVSSGAALSSLGTILLSDLTPFFLTARFLTTLFGLASLYLIYKTAESLFSSRLAGLLSAFLLATSLLHIGLSVVARHWMAATFFFALLFFILTRNTLSQEKRYFLALVISGVGTGVSPILVLGPVFIGLWHLLLGARPVLAVLKEKLVWLGVVLFGALALLPSLLYQNSNGFAGDASFSLSLDLSGLVQSPLEALGFVILSEPVFILSALVGLLFLLTKRPALFAWITLSSLSYIYVLYALFRIEARFLLPLTLFAALAGGYALLQLYSSRFGKLVLFLVLLVPLVAALQFSLLVHKNDTRAQAHKWTASLSPEDRVITGLHLTRYPTTAEAVAELELIESAAIRRFDLVDKELPTQRPHILNLRTVADAKFFTALPEYAKTYDYLIIDERFLNSTEERRKGFEALIREGTLVTSFEGLHGFSLGDSSFEGSLIDLFKGKVLGPTVWVYRLASE